VMFAVSTCWKSHRAECADDILGPILDTGVTAIELEYRISEKIFEQMLPALKREEPAVVSVHNLFPLLAHLTGDKASGDAFLLSSPDREEPCERWSMRTRSARGPSFCIWERRRWTMALDG